MNIIIDGVVYGFQKFGGINTYFNQVLPRIAQSQKAGVEILLPRGYPGKVPDPPVRNTILPHIPRRTGLSWKLDRIAGPALCAINSRVRDLYVRTMHATLFVSSYFTVTRCSIPQIGMALDMNHELFPEIYTDEWGLWLRRQYPQYLRRATKIIAISHKTREDVIRFYGIDPSLIHVVHLAVNTEEFWPDPVEHSEDRVEALAGIRRPFLLYVGGRFHCKNFGGLLRAFAQTRIRTDVSLVVAGKRLNSQEQQLIKSLDLESAVQVVENPSIEVMRRLYSSALAFVFPSFHEGFGIPLLEAMACGTMVLASDIDVFHEVAGDGAFYFNPNEESDIARALEIPFDKRGRAEYIARGFTNVSKYSWDRVATETFAIYQDAVRTGVSDKSSRDDGRFSTAPVNALPPEAVIK